MPDCAQTSLNFPSFDRRKIEANFTGGNVSSDGGLMLLRQADRRIGLTRALDAVLHDPRNPDLIPHRQIDLLRLRAHGSGSAHRPGRNGTCEGAGGHHPAQALENRHGDRAQHAAHPAFHFERLSLPGHLPLGERTTGQRMRRFGCRPRHAKNNGGKGECAPALVIRLKTNQNPPLVAMRTPRPA